MGQDIKLGDGIIIYEHKESNTLIGITKENQKTIKNYWKKYKGKREQPSELVEGYCFKTDETLGTLIPDFTATAAYEIKSLQKFD
ncbi:MAG: hypothetical protein ACPGU5_03435 [Lishizhenia sp.]